MDYTPEQLERLVRAEEIKAQAAEINAVAFVKFTELLPDLIEKLGKRSGGGGGNWNKKGTDRGMFWAAPDISGFSATDYYRVPATAYAYNSRYNKIVFFGPFDKDGNLSPEGHGVVVAGVKIDSKYWKECKLNELEWKQDEKPHPLLMRLITKSVGENDGRKFDFLTGVEKAENPDPTSYQYNPLPIPPAKTEEAKTEES